MSEAFVERFASVLYESDEFIESWSDASDADRHEYRAIARREVSALLDQRAHELAEKIRAEFEDAFEANQEVLSGTDAMLAADLIDPGVCNGD